MSGDIRNATMALERTIGAALPAAGRPYVSVGRPGWSWRDLLGDRVNLCIVQSREDRGQTNDLLPSRPNTRAVSSTYLVTFYGKGVEDHLQAIMAALIRRPYLGADDGATSTGLKACLQNPSLEDMAEIWGLFRRKYALSIIIEVKGTIVSAD